jgi:hypothetical protein
MNVYRVIADEESLLTARVEARKQTPTGNALNVQVGPGDTISNIPIWLDLAEHQIHEGESHYAQDARLAATTAVYKFAIVVPVFSNPIQGPHMIVAANVYNNAVRVDIYEGATYTGGTALTVFNRNRNSAIVPGTSIIGGVTSTDGSLVQSFFAGAGAKAAGNARSGSEWVLKSNTKYRIDVTAQVNPTDIITSFEFYEDLGV